MFYRYILWAILLKAFPKESTGTVIIIYSCFCCRGKNFLHTAIMKGDLESLLFLLSISVNVQSKATPSYPSGMLHSGVFILCILFFLFYPLVPSKFFSLEFLDEISYRGALWDLIRKSKISGQYLHTLPRYENFKIFGFFYSVTLFYTQLLSNPNWLKLRTRQTQNR